MRLNFHSVRSQLLDLKLKNKEKCHKHIQIWMKITEEQAEKKLKGVASGRRIID